MTRISLSGLAHELWHEKHTEGKPIAIEIINGQLAIKPGYV
jgi:hypothetical protein